MFVISAVVPEGRIKPKSIFCFDPTIVVERLRELLDDEIEITEPDYTARVCDEFQRMNVSPRTMRVAENDDRRRGPVIGFRINSDSGMTICGQAERYYVHLSCEAPIPEPIKSIFLSFFREVEGISLKTESYFLDGNERHDS